MTEKKSNKDSASLSTGVLALIGFLCVVAVLFIVFIIRVGSNQLDSWWFRKDDAKIEYTDTDIYME